MPILRSGNEYNFQSSDPSDTNAPTHLPTNQESPSLVTPQAHSHPFQDSNQNATTPTNDNTYVPTTHPTHNFNPNAIPYYPNNGQSFSPYSVPPNFGYGYYYNPYTMYHPNAHLPQMMQAVPPVPPMHMFPQSVPQQHVPSSNDGPITPPTSKVLEQKKEKPIRKLLKQKRESIFKNT